jgi:(2R)-ethylmalonyl-CoA mutase
VIGVNRFTESADSPLVNAVDEESHILVVDEKAEQEQLEHLERWRAERDAGLVAGALETLRATAATTANLVPASIALARAGGTVGEWAGALRDVFGEYRAPTGVTAARAPVGPGMQRARERVQATEQALGHPIRMLVGKPGLDGHSNGAEQIALAARDAGMEVIYQGIRLTPEQIVAAARDEDVDLVGLSVLSGSHRKLVQETMDLLRAAGVDAPVVVGGIIPDADQAELVAAGVARVYTPKDFRLTEIVGELAELAAPRSGG